MPQTSTESLLPVNRNGSTTRTFSQSIATIQPVFHDNAGVLGKFKPCSYDTYRTIRRHPTVAFARALSSAPIVSSEWRYEETGEAPDGAIEFIKSQLDPLRARFLEECSTFGSVDYGWIGFEKVFGYVDVGGRKLVGLSRLKMLLVDITDILVINPTGEFWGFRQTWPLSAYTPITPEYREGWFDIGSQYAMLVNFRTEADNHYGEPLLESTRKPFANWEDCNKGAERYDNKLAGAIWVVHYPPGTTRVDGAEKDNFEIASALVKSLEASGSVVVPRQISSFVEDLNKSADMGETWTIDLKDHSAKQADFVARLGYIDKQLVRSLLIPERTALEGEYGTRADAGVHASIALDIRESEHRRVCAQLNAQLVDQLLVANFGDAAKGTVRVCPAPLADTRRAFFEAVYQAAMSNPASSMQALDLLDLPALMDAVGIPKRELTVDGSSAEGDGGEALIAMMKRLSESVAAAGEAA